MTLSLGCIADDFTGATDLALLLSDVGANVIQTIGIPGDDIELPPCDALVVALKSRTTPAASAVSESLAAWAWLKAQGMSRCFFKYCSTFDSTPAGNIGPVTEALLAACDVEQAVACPAFPVNGRTVYRGNLFVGDMPLNESPLRNHPLTPMTDANLVRVLGAQSTLPVGLVPWPMVSQGADAVREALSAAAARGERMVIVDAIEDADLEVIGEAVRDHTLVTGGSALGAALASSLLAGDGETEETRAVDPLPLPEGHAVVLAGSCSEATLGQIEHARHSMPSRRLDVDEILSGGFDLGAAVQWAAERLEDGPVLFYSSESADRRAERNVSTESGAAIEAVFAQLALALLAEGVRRFVVAGGETSGAVVNSLGVSWLRIGAAIAPGVPWTVSGGDEPVALALKSGNFGAADFFVRALEMADGG